jgi:hemerythrin
MQKIIWDKRYNIDNGIIDKQHQYLVKLINLIADETEYISTEAVKAIFVELIHYANIHFHDEEEIMMKTNYPHKKEHKQEHRKFVEDLEKIELDVIFENPKAIDKILKFLKEWLINHILISDKDFAPFLYSDEE